MRLDGSCSHNLPQFDSLRHFTMLNWRARMQLRRRARRRYLAVVHGRWRAAGAPREHGSRRQLMVTLLWLVVPFCVAVVAAGLVWLVRMPPGTAHAEVGLLLIPILGVAVLLRR
jgi:hypothetical protein